MATSAEATLAQLTGAGGPFEVGEELVLGERMAVFTKRQRSLRDLLVASAAHGDRDYIVLGDRRITYRQHLALVASTARALAEVHGVRRGDRVAILAENHPEWIIGFWAAVSLGAIVSALNGWWTPAEIRHALGLVEPRVILADRKRAARLEGFDPGAPVVRIEDDGPSLLSYAPGAELPSDPLAEDDPAVILFTSGTTGRSKGAVASHRGIVGFVQLAFWGGVRRRVLDASKPAASSPASAPSLPQLEPCTLVTVPLFHLSGLYAGAVMMLGAGARTVWRLGRFDPLDVLRLIERERVTGWTGLGSMAPRVLGHPDLAKFDLSSLRNLGSGGAPTSPALQDRMRAVAPTGASAVGLGYGSTETVSAVTSIGGEELCAHPTSVGPPLPTCAIEIRDESGRALPEGEEGEIFVRSPYVMLEYWRDPEATARAVRAGRWLATGDIGRLEGGLVYINSRARDLILRAAENVYPVEIEHRLEEHPAVGEAAVIGVDHPELGQEVKAIVVPASAEARIDFAELAAWAGETLAPYKVPSQWEIRAEPLPRNAAGKVLKNVLRGEATVAFAEE
ncbi:MAG: acyl--CoA ligase [Deltaproteobacteria bacterium]|nr:acyl--CoA ligase [Deltaproteobacteria bacterium]